MFEDKTVEIPCPQCGRKIAKKVGQFPAHGNHETDCPGCGARIRVDADKFTRGIRDAEKGIAELKRNFGKLFK